jgi:predicted PurR-regulated permease PerM
MAMNQGWSRALRYLALIMLLMTLAWVLLAVRALIGPLIMAALLAYVLNPAVTLIKTRTRLRHNASVSLVYFLFLAVLAAILVSLVPIVAEQARRVALELQVVRIRLEEALVSPVTFLGFELPLDELLVEIDGVSAPLFKPQRVLRTMMAATANLAWIMVILVTAYHLLRDWERLREWLIRLAPEAYQPDARRLLKEIKAVWQAHLRGQLLLMLLVGFLTGLGSAAIGLRHAMLLGLLAGGLDLIPSLGPIVAMVIAVAVAWFEGSTYLLLSKSWVVAMVIALYILVQQMENIWLQPRIMGRRLRLHPGLIFVAVAGALTLGGTVVALIIVPLLASAGVVGRYVHRRMLGLEPWPEAVDTTSVGRSPNNQSIAGR